LLQLRFDDRIASMRTLFTINLKATKKYNPPEPPWQLVQSLRYE
jgi:hypothetical protein